MFARAAARFGRHAARRLVERSAAHAQGMSSSRDAGGALSE
jgi:hypothetical protein